eukprot:scaffold76_cov363-Pavlova_lutheri.AAC.11
MHLSHGLVGASVEGEWREAQAGCELVVGRELGKDPCTIPSTLGAVLPPSCAQRCAGHSSLSDENGTGNTFAIVVSVPLNAVGSLFTTCRLREAKSSKRNSKHHINLLAFEVTEDIMDGFDSGWKSSCGPFAAPFD